MKESVKELWANKDFVRLAGGYALGYGAYCTIGGTISNLLNPFGYSPGEISIAGGSCMLTGVLGALVVGVFVDQTSLYRKTHLFLSFMILVSVVLFYFTLR